MTNQRIVSILMIALVMWGVYLAIGSTGYFVETSLTDLRKSLIVVLCMSAFLGLWVYVLRTPRHRTAEQTSEVVEPTTELTRPWSRPGISSLIFVLLSILLWIAAVLSFDQLSKVTTTVLGWGAAVAVILAASTGMVALANPRNLKGKWLGACGLLQMLVALVIFILRMTPPN